MILDPKWMNILKEVMPDVYENISSKLESSINMKISCIKLMRMFENNPVIAAYGILSEGSDSAIEWDVFLDPNIVYSIEKAFEMKQTHISKEVEIDRQVSRLINRMLLAHGSTTQLVTEALNITKRFNFSRIIGSSPSAKNSKCKGMFVTEWLRLFDMALQLGTEKYQNIPQVNDTAVTYSKPFCSLFLCLGMEDPNSSIVTHTQPCILEIMDSIHEILGRPLRVVLDLKSRHVSLKFFLDIYNDIMYI